MYYVVKGENGFRAMITLLTSDFGKFTRKHRKKTFEIYIRSTFTFRRLRVIFAFALRDFW